MCARPEAYTTRMSAVPTTQPKTTAQPRVDDLAALSADDLIRRYAGGAENLERRVLDLTDSQADTFFRQDAGVGRWSCRALVGHLADAEIVQAHRLRRTVAEEHPVFSIWDENAFVDAQLYCGERGGADRPIAGFVAVIHTMRLWTGEWLRTLGPEAWIRRALHPERGEVTVRTILALTTWHLEHHAWYLSRKLERVLGPATD